MRPLKVGAKRLALGLDQGFREKLFSTLSTSAIGRNGLVKQDTAVFLGADSGRGTVLDVVVAHAAGEVALVLA